MTERRLCALALKVWGLLWSASALLSIPQIILLMKTEPFRGEQRDLQIWSRWSSVAGTTSALIFGIVLLIGAERIAAFLVADRDLAVPLGPTLLEQAGFGILGAYLLILAVRELAVVLYVLRMKPEWDSTGTLAYMWQNSSQAMVGASVQGVLALALLLGRRSLSRLWLKLHPMQQLPPDEQEVGE